MSLRAFHILFIIISIVLCVGFGAWGARLFSQSGSVVYGIVVIAALITAVALTRYIFVFVKKTRMLVD